MADTLIAAVVQLCARQDVQENLEKSSNLVARAAARGARLVLLPENFAYIRSLKDKLGLAEPMPGEGPPGPMLSAMIQAARDNGVYLVLGGTPIRSPDPGRFYNTSILLDPQGQVLACYRKIHLFDVNIPHGAVFTESDWVVPGDRPVTAQVLGRTLGFSICYDLRFPELYRQLTDRGAEVLLAPAAFTLHTGKEHWFPLLRTRAIESQCYLLAAAQQGHHAPGRDSFGHSCIVDPWGAIVAQAPDTDGIAVAELDFDYLARVRRELPALAHRRVG
jgi:predicted amidohydrolase